jgi:hypothetical protein
MLKSAMPTARIIEFVYKGEGSKPQTFPEVAADLLEILSIHQTDCPKRPIMFVAHRVGGVILQKSMALDRAPEVLLRPSFEDHKFPDHIFANVSRGDPLLSQPPPTNTTSM